VSLEVVEEDEIEETDQDTKAGNLGSLSEFLLQLFIGLNTRVLNVEDRVISVAFSGDILNSLLLPDE
jgi:hypothetical protein